MKKILASLLALAMLFAFTACNPDSTQKTPGEELKDMFTSYASKVTVNDDGTGVVLGQEADETSRWGASTWLGETDKLTDFGDESITVSFQLDLSSMVMNDYTVFSLAYGDHTEGDDGWTFNYKTETIFSVMKTADGYTVGQVNNVFYNDNDGNRGLLNASANKKTITDADGIIDFSYTASYNEGILTVSLKAGNESLDFTINGDTSTGIKGIGYLWNCVSNIDTVEMLSLSKN